jgi:omega-6 fatty acid desaturase (delta-12 desaturase)
MSEKPIVSPRSGKALFDATAPFAEEVLTRSWWHVGSTLVVLVAVLTGAEIAPWWPLRLAASIVGGLALVRAFILYHDFMHGALLPGSRLAQVVFYTLGLLMLTPPRYWRFSHNYHHAHVGKVIVAKENAFPVLTSDICSYPLMSTEG